MINTKVDLGAIAHKVVNECLLIKPGENFWISCGDNYYYDFAQELAIAAIRAGAHPLITMSSDVISRKKYDNPEEYLKKPSAFSPAIIQAAQVQLVLGFSPGSIISKRRFPGQAGGRIYRRSGIQRSAFAPQLRPGQPAVFVIFISNSRGGKKEPVCLLRITRTLYGMRWTLITRRCPTGPRKIAKIIDKGSQVQIKTEDGTDLKFSIKGRPSIIDDGVMDQEDVESNNYLQNLPTGEVYVAPVEDSANGTANFQYNIFEGEPLVNFRVRFENGRIVEMKADQGLDHYRDIMEEQTGEKYRIAELGIGLNPKVTKVIGELALDEKIIGTIHIATGENRMFAGGVNEASIHWDMVMKSPTLIIDGKTIMKKGKYKI